MPSEEHWTSLHSIKPLCDVKCKVGCWGGLRHPLCSTLPYQRIFTVEWNIQRQGTQSSEEALCIQVGPCLFVFSVRHASALVSAAICLFLLVALLCLEQVWDLRSWQKVLRDCLSPEVERGLPCDGAVMWGWFLRVGLEKITYPESAIWPSQAWYRLHFWAQINNTKNSA